MIQRQRQPWARPGAVLVAATLLTGALVALSFVVQPPSESERDMLLGSLAWGRSLVFSIGIVGFVVGLAGFTNTGDPAAQDQSPIVPMPAPKQRGETYTVVALGVSVEDARAIDEAPEAADAITLALAWRSARPNERIVIYGPDGRILAFRRPAKGSRRTRIKRAA